jgi:site-specific DNA-methyltransferase (adenine-specific)
LLRIVKSSTTAGDVILDPFNGGGTTGIATIITGERYYIGIEIEKEYCKLTKKKMMDLTKDSNQTLFALA